MDALRNDCIDLANGSISAETFRMKLIENKINPNIQEIDKILKSGDATSNVSFKELYNKILKYKDRYFYLIIIYYSKISTFELDNKPKRKYFNDVCLDSKDTQNIITVKKDPQKQKNLSTKEAFDWNYNMIKSINFSEVKRKNNNDGMLRKVNDFYQTNIFPSKKDEFTPVSPNKNNLKYLIMLYSIIFIFSGIQAVKNFCSLVRVLKHPLPKLILSSV